MALVDDAKAETDKTRHAICSVAKLDPDLIAEIDEALAADGVTASAVERALANRGVRLKAFTLRRHRGKDCTCEPG